MASNRPLNLNNTPYSGSYWAGTAYSAGTGAVLGGGVGLLPAAALPYATMGAGAVGVGFESRNAYQEFSKGNYASGTFHVGMGSLSAYGGFGRFNVSSAPSSALNRGAQLRQNFGSQFDEYMHFRSQGFTPAQSKYLTQPYGNRAGHHFPIPQRTGRDRNIPRSIIDSRLTSYARET